MSNLRLPPEFLRRGIPAEVVAILAPAAIKAARGRRVTAIALPGDGSDVVSSSPAPNDERTL